MTTTVHDNRACLADLNFIDIYVGAGIFDVKVPTPEGIVRQNVPEIYLPAAHELLTCCLARLQEMKTPDFAIQFDGVMFRSSQMTDTFGERFFVLRRMPKIVKTFDDIALPPWLTKILLEPDLRGLVVVAGEMGTGKTTTAAATVLTRLRDLGGVALTLEDPPELNMHGLHGKGRCIQVAVTAENGGYKQQMVRAMRSAADIIMIGEIREEEVAFQAIQASLNGHLVISTTHAGDIRQAIERLATFARPRVENVSELLAYGLTAVIHQELHRRPDGSAVPKVSVLSMFGNEGQSARSSLRQGRTDQLIHEIEMQARRRFAGSLSAASSH